MDVRYKNAHLVTATLEDQLNHSYWEICDNSRTLYRGTQDEMEEIFEYLTVPTNELISRYPEKIPLDIYKNSKMISRVWQGELRLIEIHQKFFQPDSFS